LRRRWPRNPSASDRSPAPGKCPRLSYRRSQSLARPVGPGDLALRDGRHDRNSRKSRSRGPASRRPGSPNAPSVPRTFTGVVHSGCLLVLAGTAAAGLHLRRLDVVLVPHPRAWLLQASATICLLPDPISRLGGLWLVVRADRLLADDHAPAMAGPDRLPEV